MTTGDLVGKLAENWELEPAETRKVLDAAVQNMCDQLAQGNDFSIPGLGAFRTETKGKQQVFDEQEQVHKMMPPRRVITFTPIRNEENGDLNPEGNHE